jgi:hypothetical protein
MICADLAARGQALKKFGGLGAVGILRIFSSAKFWAWG